MRTLSWFLPLAVFFIFGQAHPSDHGFPWQKYRISNYQEAQVKAGDGVIVEAWFFPVKGAKGTLIVVTGRGSDRCFGLYQSRFLLKHGYQILVYNTRYWEDSINPMKTVEKDLQDIGALINYLKARKDVDAGRIGILGFSIGAYRSILAGARYSDLKVVVEDGAPVCMEDKEFMVMDGRTIRLTEQRKKEIEMEMGYPCFSETYNSLLQVGRIAPRPILVISGEKDRVVPPDENKRHFLAALEPKQWATFPHAIHCLGMENSRDKTAYIKTIVDFLDRYLK